MPSYALRPASVQTTSIKSWQQGVVTADDVPRLAQGALASSGNTILVQNGAIRPRPSLIPYGAQPTGTVLGEIFEFRNTTTTPILNYRICMQVVGGVAQVYTSKDLGAWTAASGKTYSTTAKAHFCQIDNKVLIMNGVDTLSYYGMTSGTVTPFASLTTPSAPTLTTNTGLTGTSFTITYRVAANSTIGNTIASTVLSVQVSTDRDFWTPTTQNLTISWAAVTGAASYNVYMGVGGAGTEYQIATGITGLTYKDDGTAYQDTTHSYPLVDSTAGPKATRADNINGQVFLSGIGDQLYSVIAGGTYPHALDFSPANGGDTVSIGAGGKDLPIRVRLFRNNNGASAIKVYCSGTNGHGKRYTMTPNSVTVANQTVDFFDVTEDSGEDGTTSPDGIVYYNDSNYYPSTDGFKTDGTLPQLQNIISTRRVSNTIQDDIRTLNTDAMANCVGLGYEGRLYWAVASNSTTNNEIWVCDLDRGGAWMKPWSIAADWMMLYNSNTVANGGDGMTHFCILQNNQIYELSYTRPTSDNGVTVTVSGNSGRIYFSDDQRTCAKLLKVVFTVLRPAGRMTVGMSGQFRGNTISESVTTDFDADTSTVGWSENQWSAAMWSEVVSTPVSNNSASEDIIVKVNKEVRWWDYNFSASDPGVDFELSDVVAIYVKTGNRDL